MDIADSIIEAIETQNESRKQSKFDHLRPKIKQTGHLGKEDFKRLVATLGSHAVEILATPDLSVKECRLLGKALMAAKLQDIEKIIDCIITHHPNRAGVLLCGILCKGAKVDFSACLLGNYIEDMLSGEVVLSHLMLLSAISRNYPNMIDQKIIGFCQGKTHPICKMIVEKHHVAYE